MKTGLNTLADRAAGAVENAAFLDPVGAGVARLLSPLRQNTLVSALLGGEPLGHPAHPAIVVLPLGSWISASILDVVGNDEHHDAARTLTGAGVVLAVPAALTGAHDWLPTSGSRQRVGVAHWALNTASLVCFSTSWLARTRGRRSAGMRWSLAGLGLSAVSAWLGGHLAYNQGVGVRRSNAPAAEESVETPPADLVDVLVGQHRALSELMRHVASAHGEERARGFLQLRRDLAAHEAAEQAIVHRLTRQDLPGGEAIATAREGEESKAAAALTELEQFDPDSDDFEQRFGQLRQDVEAHAEHEETEELARLRRDRGRDGLVPVGDTVRAAQAAALRRLVEDGITSFPAMVEVARDAVRSTPQA